MEATLLGRRAPNRDWSLVSRRENSELICVYGAGATMLPCLVGHDRGKEGGDGCQIVIICCAGVLTRRLKPGQHCPQN
jgi:hypothetical protein